MKTIRYKILDIDKNFLAEEAVFHLKKAKWWEGRFLRLRWLFRRNYDKSINLNWLKIHIDRLQ